MQLRTDKSSPEPALEKGPDMWGVRSVLKSHSLRSSSLRRETCAGLILLIASCAHSDKETYLASARLDRLKRVAITTSIEPPEVSYASADPALVSWAGMFLLPVLIGMWGESEADRQHGAKVKDQIEFDTLKSKLVQSFVQTAKNGVPFQMNCVIDGGDQEAMLKAAGYDATIRLSVVSISLRKTTSGYVNLSARVRGHLTVLRSGETLWDREELVVDPELYALDHFKEEKIVELDAVVTKAGRNLAYDFAYRK
jgi:hypothetical protein